MSKAEIITLGCRLNAYESEVMRQHLSAAAINDAVVINTCAVTGEAVRQAKQTIRRARREKPDARIIVTGCAAQIDPEAFAALDEVDHVIGNDEKMRPETFERLSISGCERVQVNDIMGVTETAHHLLDGFGSRGRAYVQVQNGCDHRCTFCIIPYGRGRSRSVPAGDVIRQVQNLVDQGYLEVVLSGVDMTSYGNDLPGRASIGTLVRQILKHVPGLKRLRLSSIDQVEVDDDLMRAVAEEDRLMPHLHLSLQSGDNLILKRMKRRHCRDEAIAFCEKVRKLRPDVVYGADLIAGFPTETDEMFEKSVDLVRECGLTYLHVFPFSSRKGTPAARMPQLDRKIVKDRAARLRAVGDRVRNTYLSHQVGQQPEIYVETPRTGRTPQFAEVTLDKDVAVRTLAKVRVTGLTGNGLRGEVVV